MILNPWYWAVFAAAVAGFRLAPARARHAVLGAACLGWWAWVSPRLAAVILAWTLLVYLAAPRTMPGRPHRRAWYWGGVALLLLHLVAAKALHGAPAPEGASWFEAHALCTLGVSYYTLKFIHVLTESARGTLPGLALSRFVSYSVLMPTFTAGPIERYDHYVESAAGGRVRAADWLEGLERIAVGLVKKALPVAWLGAFLFDADHAPCALTFAGQPAAAPLLFWTHAAAMFLYIYLDFSAYSDIAIGSARLLGIRIVENFNFPFLARNLPDFWRRWHISLGAWCRSYVYMPVLGATRNPYLAAYASLVVFGLWHAGTWLRLVWGLYQGTGVALFMAWTQWRRRHGLLQPRPAAAWVLQGLERAFALLWLTAGMAFLLAECADPEHSGLLAGLRLFGGLFGL
jgi:alginate O-acetyltransferase complex protein AlgI